MEYWSKLLSKAERRYTVTEIECKAVHDSIMHWNTYLSFPTEFTVYTDHHSLIYMVVAIKQTSNARVLRWMLDLQGYRFSLLYKRGTQHANADAISRLLRYHDEEIETSKDTERTDFGPLDNDEIQHAMSEILNAKAMKKDIVHKLHEEVNNIEKSNPIEKVDMEVDEKNILLFMDCTIQDILFWITKFNIKNKRYSGIYILRKDLSLIILEFLCLKVKVK